MVNPMLLDAANLLQAIVDIEYTEPDTGYTVTHREEFDGSQPLANRSLIIPTLAKNPGPLKYTTTVIKMDGVVHVQEDQSSEDGIILVSEGTGVVQRIKVRLPNNTIGDRIAVKVDLTGTGEQPDQTDRALHLEPGGRATGCLGAARQRLAGLRLPHHRLRRARQPAADRRRAQQRPDLHRPAELRPTG